MTRAKPEDHGEVLLYRTEDGRTALDVRLAGGDLSSPNIFGTSLRKVNSRKMAMCKKCTLQIPTSLSPFTAWM